MSEKLTEAVSIRGFEDDFVRSDLEQMSRAPRYLAYQYEQIQPYLGRRILEVGTGIGNITERILPGVDLLVGLEPNVTCFDEVTRRLAGHPALQLVNSAIEDVGTEGLQRHDFDTVLCINVLEHILDDRSITEKFAQVLAAGGQLVLIVPSPRWSYGVIDKAVGHYRRYSRADVVGLVARAGLTVRVSRYFNPIGLLGWLYNAKVARIQQQSDLQIAVFDRLVVPLQRRLERWLPVPVGQSLLVVATKDRSHG
jgi:2-polyprenyl-3-methyl-5-hydroxy-6-metoxy-1,4-benzoquinol methylase